MDETIVDRAVKSAMEIYCGDDHSFVEIICRSAIEAYEKAIAETGFVIVPKTPTQEMLDAVCSDDPNAIIRAHDVPVRETYMEMIAVAPQYN